MIAATITLNDPSQMQKAYDHLVSRLRAPWILRVIFKIVWR